MLWDCSFYVAKRVLEELVDMEKRIRKSIAKFLTKEKFTLEDLKKELEGMGDKEFILVIPLKTNEKEEGSNG